MNNIRPAGTPFFRLDQQNGWRMAAASAHIIADPLQRGLRLGQSGYFAIAPNESFGSFGGMTLVRGVSINPQGQLLLADPAHNRILYFANTPYPPTSTTTSATEHAADSSAPPPMRPLWQTDTTPQPADVAVQHSLFQQPQLPATYALAAPQDLLFLADGSLAVADTGHSRLLIYSWPELRLLHQQHWPGSRPVALAQDSKAQLYIADASGSRVLLLNRHWQYTASIATNAPPAAIAVDQQDNLLLLDSNKSLHLYQPRTAVGATGFSHTALPIHDSSIFTRRFRVPPLQLIQQQLQYRQSGKPLGGEAELSMKCDALRLTGLSVDRHGYLKGTTLPLLAREQRLRLPRSGSYLSEQLDSKQQSGQWHRLVLDAEIPAGGRILLSTYSSDRPLADYELSEISWSEPMLLAPEAPFNQPEILIQSGPGRYLRLKVEMLGDGYTSPFIRSMQLFGLRHSALHYLPPPYLQDAQSAYFLDRWLSYFDTLHDEIRFLLHDFSRYLDPHGVPAGPFLEWLGSWFDWQFLAQWPEHLRRDMIKQSLHFFQHRGTVSGLRQMLQWHTGLTGDQPQFIEHFRLRHYNSSTPLYIAGMPLTPPEQQLSHYFTVLLPASVVADDDALQQLLRLIEAQKPAHTGFDLRVFNTGLRIGKQSAIGLDTWLGHYPSAPLGAMTLRQSANLQTQALNGIATGQHLLSQRC